MHRALQLDDIIRVVFDYINELSVHYWPGNNVGHKTLAALARTCKIFHEPALDILWGDLYFPHPLIRCFSTRLPHFNSWGEHGTKTLTVSEWEVLQKYVPRVRSLTFHSEAPFYRNVLEALRNPPVAQPPLPNLQRLHYSHFVPEDYPLLDIFFVPSLTDLTIELHPISLPDISFISPIAISCPHLTSFRLFGYGSHEPTLTVVSNVIMILPHLQKLRCDALNQAAITYIAWHPSLTELDITIPSGRRQYDFVQFPHRTLPRIPPFSRINSFGMSSVRLTTISEFIREVQPSPFHLRIMTDQVPSPHDLQKFFSTLSNRERQGSMQILHLISYPSREHLPVAPVSISINIDAIQPLLRFSNLRKLYLLMVNLDFSDEHLIAMAAAWPCLEVFNFNNGDSWATPYNVTLRGLFSLVNMCPHLKSVHLAINTNVFEGIEDCPASMVGANNLQHLVLGVTAVENPRAVALIIYLALPKVKKILASNTWSRVASTNDLPWDKVNEYLEAFRLLQGGHWKA